MKGFGDNIGSAKNAANKEKPINIEELILEAVKFHSEGKIKIAAKKYSTILSNGYLDPRILNNLGIIYQQFKQTEKAVEFYKKSILNFPNSSEAYVNLGRILLERGQYDEAKKLLEKVIILNPSYSMAYTNLANICVNQKKLIEAEYYLRKCVEINPNAAENLLNLGCVLKELEKTEEAETNLRKALKLKPGFVSAYINLGAVLNDLGKYEEAEKLLHKALNLSPNSYLALNNLGNVLSAKNRFNEAEKVVREAIKMKPDFAIAHNNLGSILLSQGNLIEAESFTQKAINLNQKFELAFVNLGIINVELNNIEKAEKFFLKAIEIKANYQFAYNNLFRLYEKTNNIQKLDKSLDLLKDNKEIINEIYMYRGRLDFREKNYLSAKKNMDLVSRKWIENTDSVNKILFWSFRAFIEEKNKNYDDAFEYFRLSQLNPKYKRFDPKSFQRYINDYEKSVDSLDFGLRKKLSNDRNNPVFLIGFPRSGTTLLDTLLRSHPDIDVLEEKPILNKIEEIIKLQFNYPLHEIYKVKEDELIFLRGKYIQELRDNSDKNKNAKVLIDKFPFQTASLPLINLLFPNAKIIFTHRHPYDTVLSCYQQAFEPNNAMSNFRTLDSSAFIYDLTMNKWHKYKEKLKLNFIMSKYENLINNFEEQVSEILNFLDLPWDENIKNYRDTALRREKINTPSSSQVVEPLYKTSIEKWKNYKTYFNNCHEYLKKWVVYFNY